VLTRQLVEGNALEQDRRITTQGFGVPFHRELQRRLSFEALNLLETVTDMPGRLGMCRYAGPDAKALTERVRRL
jgi:hypothetical protein